MIRCSLEVITVFFKRLLSTLRYSRSTSLSYPSLLTQAEGPSVSSNSKFLATYTIVQSVSGTQSPHTYTGHINGDPYFHP